MFIYIYFTVNSLYKSVIFFIVAKELNITVILDDTVDMSARAKTRNVTY